MMLRQIQRPLKTKLLEVHQWKLMKILVREMQALQAQRGQILVQKDIHAR